MSVMWYNSNKKNLISTIQNNNITLNKACINFFEEAYK